MSEANDAAYYGKRAEQQLELAKAATDPAIKAIHLDLAAGYATKAELAAREEAKRGGGSA